MSVQHYCTLADVNNLVPQVPFTDTSKPNADVVKSIIDDIANEIDSYLASLYITPVVSGAQALQHLRNLNAWGTLGRAQEARTTQAVPEAMGIKSVWTKKYEEGVKAIIDPDNPFTLVDAPVNVDRVPKVASQIVSSDVLDGTDDVIQGEGLDRPDMGMQF